MADDEPVQRHSVSQRFEFIEWRLFWEGHLNRSDLEERFGISTPQASVDLRNYRELAGENIEYNATEKRFVATDRLAPRFLKISANRLLLQLKAFINGVLRRQDLWFSDIPPVDVAPEIIREVEPSCLKKMLKGIREKKAVRVHYQSLSSSRWRYIAPHALAFDGHRWHARAWCCESEEFRDFVLTRISRIGDFMSVKFDPEADNEWHEKIVLRLRPHPELTAEQKEAIQLDFHMTDGILEVETRLSMAYYFIKRMNLDLNLKAARAQIVLENLDEFEERLRQVRAAK